MASVWFYAGAIWHAGGFLGRFGLLRHAEGSRWVSRLICDTAASLDQLGMTAFEDLGITVDSCALVAEIGPAKGDLNWAYAATAAAAETGAWGIKGQLYDRNRLVTRDAPSYGKGITEPDTQWEHFDAQLTYDEWGRWVDLCRDYGVEPFFSVFDFEAVDFCERIGIRLYKIASADITYKQLVEKVATTGKPIVLSTGGSTMTEIDRALGWIEAVSPDSEVLLLVCTLSYPCPPSEAHVNRITAWPQPVGYSDHTEGISTMLAARSLGAVMIEKHFTISPGTGGDHDFAATPAKFATFSNIAEDVAGPDDRVFGEPWIGPLNIEKEAVTFARRSLAAKVDIRQGERLTAKKLCALRPGTRFEPWRLDEFVGTKAPRFIAKGELL